jgi:alkanesulfonate monooxygenase SsuD/methylene tetrahydromethanopterin reductase-like flavin-dependent oxidoreductase (luciferase family)
VVAIAAHYDLRSPSWAATTHAEAYAACLEQCSWLEHNGAADLIALTEHHGMDDGWLPSPVTLAAAIGARTTSLTILITAIITPLHDPIRLAEQLAVADLVSKGRVKAIMGIGYADHELVMAGIDRKQRGRIAEEHIRVMQRAWTGEELEWRGRTVRVRPLPYTKPHPLLMIGGGSEAAVRRAVRLRLPFLSAIDDPHLVDVYNDEAAKVGYAGFAVLPKGPAGGVHVTEDPEKAWAELGKYIEYETSTYRALQTGGTRSGILSHATDIEGIRKEGVYRIVTPDECVALANEIEPDGTIVLNPLLCGMPVDVGWASLELFHAKVLPRIRP